MPIFLERTSLIWSIRRFGEVEGKNLVEARLRIVDLKELSNPSLTSQIGDQSGHWAKDVDSPQRRHLSWEKVQVDVDCLCLWAHILAISRCFLNFLVPSLRLTQKWYFDFNPSPVYTLYYFVSDNMKSRVTSAFRNPERSNRRKRVPKKQLTLYLGQSKLRLRGAKKEEGKG